MRCSLSLLVVILAALTSCQEETPLIRAIRSKSSEQLKSILVQAKVEYPADADVETLRSLLFEHAQREIPGGEVKPWPGPGGPSAESKLVETERKAKMCSLPLHALSSWWPPSRRVLSAVQARRHGGDVLQEARRR